MILTLDYLRGFYDGVTHKDTPAADACRQVEKIITGENATAAAEVLQRFCLNAGGNCKGCPFKADSPETICVLRGDLPQDWAF